MAKMVNYSMRAGDILPESIYRNFQRLVHNTRLSQSELAKCTITMYDLNDCKLTLAIDRTNWRYGESDINLLVLSPSKISYLVFKFQNLIVSSQDLVIKYFPFSKISIQDISSGQSSVELVLPP